MRLPCRLEAQHSSSCSIPGHFVMLNPLSNRNQSGIFNLDVRFFRDHFRPFNNNTFHSLAFVRLALSGA